MDNQLIVHLSRIIADQQVELETLRDRVKGLQSANRKLTDDLSHKVAELEQHRGKKVTTNAQV